MSASIGTIRRPMAQGSILGAVSVGVATVVAAGALAWGALNLTAAKPSATPVAAPTYLDRGSRFEAPQAAPAPYSVGKPGNVTPRFDTQDSHNRGLRAS
jgi:hypothetical protein